VDCEDTIWGIFGISGNQIPEKRPLRAILFGMDVMGNLLFDAVHPANYATTPTYERYPFPQKSCANAG